MKFQFVSRRLAVAGAFLLSLGAIQQARAATFTVANTNDSGTGSLRQAISDASVAADDDTIVFDPTIFAGTHTINLTSGELAVTTNGKLSITGPSTGSLILSGNDASRIFNIKPNSDLTLSSLIFTRGSGPGGGAIYSDRSPLAINDCTFSNNNSTSGGGGGAIVSLDGPLTVNRSTFSHNTAPPMVTENGKAGGTGGAIANLHYSDTTALGLGTINDSTFADNSSLQGGAIYNNGMLVVNSSTFARNKADGYGGAIFNVFGTATINSSTLATNIGSSGAAISNFDNSGSQITLNNSIVASNTTASGDSSSNFFGTVNTGDYNLVDSANIVLPGTHNVLGQNPKLGVLSNNGGPTQTFALLSGSPAIDAGNSTFSTDQRGFTRPVDLATVANAAGGNGSDIGAYELSEDYQSGSNFIVTTADDHNDGVCGITDCTLREAINAANSFSDDNTISFNAAAFAAKQTIGLTGSLPAITSNLSITGPNTPGAGVTLAPTGGATSSDILQVSSGLVSVTNLTFSNTQGNGIVALGGRVTVDSCTFTKCGTGIQNGSDAAVVNVKNSTFVLNTIAGFTNNSLVDRTDSSLLDSCTLTQNHRGIILQKGNTSLYNSIVVSNGSNIDFQGGSLAYGNCLINGTTTQAGLDPAGLKNNGGPTQTIALLPSSPAINTGSTTLTTDQRGQLRDSAPDIGAFENIAPVVVSVSPQGASDKVGAKRTFTLTMSDGNGAGDLREMWLLINRQLDWNDGATLIYRPSATSPTDGQLFLRSGDNFLSPITIGTGASSSSVLDNGAVRVVATDVTVSVSGNAITLTLPLTIRDGLVGQNGLFARAQDSAGAVDLAAQAGDSGFVREGSYTVTAQFAGATNNAPTLSKLTPGATNTTLNGSGLAPAAQSFGFFVQDADGIGDIESVWFLANKTRGSKNSATFIYYPRTRRLVLRSDDDNSVLGGGKIGTPGIIENSQVRVDLSKVKLTIANDGKSLGLTLPLQAKSGLLGSNGVWLRVQDTHGITSPDGDPLGFVRKGTWNVKANTAADTKPSNGNS